MNKCTVKRMIIFVIMTILSAVIFPLAGYHVWTFGVVLIPYLLNIKLMKTGGIYPAQTLCSLAEAYGIKCMIGGMLEGAVATTAAAHFAAARRNIGYVDLDGPLLGRINPVEGGVSFDGHLIHLSDAAGLGIHHIQKI